MTDMKYTSRTVRSNEPGLTQEQALSSLYTHYGADIRVTSVKRRGDSWVVRFDQKVAEFPPKDDEASESKPFEPKGESSDEPVDGPPSEDGDGPPEDVVDGPPGDEGDGPEEKDPQGEILHLLHEIATALGVGGGLHDKIGPEGEHPEGLPPGPDAGLDAGPPGLDAGAGGPPPLKKPTKLRPGEVLPNQTPIGAPAFASTGQAMTLTVESDQVDPREYRASQAQSELEAACPGYKVEQLTFDRTARVYRALLSAH